MHRRARKRTRDGFTLIEIMVALVLAATVLLGAKLVFVQLADSRAALARSAGMTDRERNARSLMAAWLRQVDVSPTAGTTPARSFEGSESDARFTSWCLGAGGWERECRVTIHVGVNSGGPLAMAVASTGDSARQRLAGHAVALRYLLDTRDGGHWLRTWGAGPTVPLAIGVVTDVDTLMWRIGPRG